MGQRNATRRQMLATVGAAVGAGLAGCGSSGGENSGDAEGGESAMQTEPPTATGATAPATETQAAQQGWRTTELTDVRTDETFTIEELNTDPVLLEFFAVWCPVCTRQQRQMGAVRDRREDVALVSLNVDPNENAATIRNHIEAKGFDWHYAVAPPEMTRQLVDQFGTVVTNPPSAPVISSCPDGSARLLPGTGVKGVETLAAAIDEC